MRTNFFDYEGKFMEALKDEGKEECEKCSFFEISMLTMLHDTNKFLKAINKKGGKDENRKK